jgi:hypothetical protein
MISDFRAAFCKFPVTSIWTYIVKIPSESQKNPCERKMSGGRQLYYVMLLCSGSLRGHAGGGVPEDEV